jgi:glycosyltransferase 2 family protein
MVETVGRPPEPAGIEVIDHQPTRIRRPLDLFRLIGLLVLLVVLGGFGTYATSTAHGADDDLTRLLNGVPKLLIHLLSLFGSLGVLVVPVVLVVREIVRGQSRRLLEGLATGLATIGVVALLNLLVSEDAQSRLHGSLTAVANGGAAEHPIDAYLAAVVAFVTVLGVGAEAGWRALCGVAIGLYVLSAFVAGQATILALSAALAVGAAVAVAVRYVAGSANERPNAPRIAAELVKRGIVVARMASVADDEGPYRRYSATTQTGDCLIVQVLDRDMIASGVLYGLYRRFRIRAAVAAPMPLTMEGIAERRSLLATAAVSSGAHLPPLIGGVPCGADTIVLAYADIPATVATTLTDDQLADLWRNVEMLHHARMTHRGLTPEHILIDDQGKIVLPIPTDGAVFASDLRISLSRAQLLITSAQMVGAVRSIETARTILGDEELAATVPLLQPVALTRETRAALKKDDSVLESLRKEIPDLTRQEPAEPIRVERFRPRLVLTIVAVIIAGYLIVGQLGSVDIKTVLSTASWQWVPLVLLASAGTYVGAAISLTGFVSEKLVFIRTLGVQLAASFVGFVTPPSVGGLAVNIRYLRQSKISATAATTSVSVSQVVNAVTHVALLLILAAATGVSTSNSLPIPGWAFVAVGIAALCALGLLAVPGPRRWILSLALPPLREALPRLLDLLSNPVKLTEAVGGTLLLNLCYAAALWFSVRAFGGHQSFIGVAVVYLAGAAVASAAPTPGGLGAVEVALATGLAAAGMPSAAAVSAVLVFRLATFWLPVPIGWVSLHMLQRREAL